eukprot:CAMPEP_0118648718 /NCGR_PEP_ID=MMETSP0785-20121206/9310_1 /TAXON_ID=91992 /ORGANISM="Bolidomonas pacifica, Strain CCMP 1866" /LENGTH=1087 /DNA_ID=CAMNT_0006540939 /DNA_START=20 /DNA_END=3279 /DNA_ORIENTATION=+
MGSQFSMGMYPDALESFHAMDMEKIKRLYHHFSTMCEKEDENDGFFMTRRQFQVLFDIPTADVVFRIFAFFDPQQHGQVVASDVFGGLALASNSTESAKLSFIFQISDKNSDQLLNLTELTMVMHSSSRGFSRMKEIEAPPLEKIEEIAAFAFNHPEVELDERGEMSMAGVTFMASANDAMRNYLSNLDSSAGADIGNLYKQQASILRELAMIDSVLDQMSRHETDMTVDENTYETERGGDLADIVYDGLFENASDIARMYLKKLLKSDSDYKERQRELERAQSAQGGSRRKAKGQKARPKSKEDGRSSITPEEERKQQEEEAQILKEASAQAIRRAQRKRRMREEDEKEAGTFGDAAAFKIGYKRVQTSSGTAHGVGDADAAAEDAVASNNIRSRWALLRDKNNDDMVKLDVDLLEDLVEATGNLIHDREARAALEVIPTNQLGKHKVADVIKWWTSRQEARRKPPTKPWRQRLGALMEYVNRPWKFLEYLKDETNTQVQINKKEENWADWKTEEELAMEKELEDEREYQRLKAEREAKRDGVQPPGSVSAPAAAPTLFAANSAPGVSVKAWESDSEEEEEERNCKVACRVAVGHVKVEKKSSIKFDIAASNIGSTANPVTAPSSATPSNPFAPTPSSPTRPTTGGNGPPGSPSRPRSRGQTAASHIRLYARDILNNVFQTAGAEWNMKNEQSAASGGFKSVTWFDIPVKAEAKEELVNKVINQLIMFLDSVPKDYAHPVYTSSKVELVTLSSRDPKPYIRITLLNERDPFEEVEKFLPPDIKIKDAIDNLSLHVDLNISLDDIIALTKQFAGYKDRLYGPQEDELGEKGMDPAIFMNSVKQRRKAALRAARLARNKEMPLSDMKKHLASRGMSVDGTINEIRERTEQLFVLQAEIVGYGELSNFGEDISKAIFKLVDRDNDGALNFWEMNSLQRFLGGVAQEYPAKYEEAMVESGFAVNKDGWLTSDGLTAYYERFGQLANDIEDMGVGSLDDYVCANISLTGEIRSKIVQGIDKIFDGAREAQYRLKFTNFISRFVKDYYLDWECKRLSDLFIKEEVPKFLKAPGGPANLVLQWQRVLADGRRG